MATDKDSEQDALIRSNAERITRNEEAIKRQTEALEQIRDHYYPPPVKPWKKVLGFLLKGLCVVLAYAGVMQTADWYLNVRKSSAMAERCADVAERLFATEGDYAGAMRFFEKAVELDESRVSYRMRLAFVRNVASIAGLFDAGRTLTPEERQRVDAALAEATFLQSVSPDEPLPYVLAAQASVLRGEKAAALEAVGKAVELAPDKSQVRVSACALCYAVGCFDEAKQHLDAAVRLDANRPLVLFWRGTFALTVDKDVVAARMLFEELRRRAPRLALAHASRGRGLLAGPEPDIKGAALAFTQALELDPKMPIAILGMAEIAVRSDNPEIACLWYDRLLGYDPHNMKALVARARMAADAGDWKNAAAYLSNAIVLAPFRADLRRDRAAAYDELGDEAAAKLDRKMVAALEERGDAAPGNIQRKD